jgi:hypothetical protein
VLGKDYEKFTPKISGPCFKIADFVDKETTEKCTHHCRGVDCAHACLEEEGDHAEELLTVREQWICCMSLSIRVGRDCH